MREWRTGSLREKRPGVWEIRIAVATDPMTGRSIQRSFTFHGSHEDAAKRCGELADEYATCRARLHAAPFVTPQTAEMMHRLHPLRVQYEALAGENPVTKTIAEAADNAREHRKPAAA